LHKYFKINPDIAIFGKSLGNGHPITAIIGRRKIMNSSQLSFISSTFWSERVGYVAALETLKQMRKQKSWIKITKTGNIIKKEWLRLSKKYNLKLKIVGIPAISSFEFESKNSKKYITFITQEMLKKGYLANNSVYVSVMHTKKIINKYILILDECFRKIKKCEEKKFNINKLLKSPVNMQGFVRLN
jgi:glutamate-1-semialdehyde aminotransferase